MTHRQLIIVLTSLLAMPAAGCQKQSDPQVAEPATPVQPEAQPAGRPSAGPADLAPETHAAGAPGEAAETEWSSTELETLLRGAEKMLASVDGTTAEPQKVLGECGDAEVWALEQAPAALGALQRQYAPSLLDCELAARGYCLLDGQLGMIAADGYAGPPTLAPSSGFELVESSPARAVVAVTFVRPSDMDEDTQVAGRYVLERGAGGDVRIADRIVDGQSCTPPDKKVATD